MRRPPVLSVLLVVAAAFVAGVASGCTDDGYSAPDRTIDVGTDVVEGTDALAHAPLRYVIAIESVANALGVDASDPAALLLDGSPNNALIAAAVQCAWGATLADGDADSFTEVAGAGPLADRLRSATNDGDCSDLEPEDVAILARDQPIVPTSEADRLVAADIAILDGAIRDELAPEIAETLAQRR